MRLNQKINYTVQVLENGYKLTSDNIIITQIEPNIPYRELVDDITDYQKSAEKHIAMELDNPTFDNILSLEEISNKITDIKDSNVYSLFELLKENHEKETELINEYKDTLEENFNTELGKNTTVISSIMLDSANNVLNHKDIINKIEDLRLDFEVTHIE